MTASWFAPAAVVTLTAEIKKSRFITLLSPTRGTDAAKAYILQCRKQHPTAAHHCWAFIAGPPSDSLQRGFSDDGEPSGTAGKPMLAQLDGSGLGEITAVVVRYYGGIHLGTGGLVKAYGGGVQQALKQVSPVARVPRRRFVLRCDYPQLAWVEAAVQQAEGLIVEGDYRESIILTLEIPVHHIAMANDTLRDLSRGTLQLTPVPQ
ncbi:IMPACT family protein [Sodalis sp.]|uniref:IMPACT family protein n=1 Tax=Sodalis sp. (in: enterobacteria) TaxID=1898979 RepID=UPI003873654E